MKNTTASIIRTAFKNRGFREALMPQPEPIIGWWKHGPECFAVKSVEHANHLVTHWAEIPKPNVSDQTRRAQD